MENAELVKAYGPILIALFAMLTSIATAYFAYRSSSAAKTTADAASTKADIAMDATAGLRRTIETEQMLRTQGVKE